MGVNRVTVKRTPIDMDALAVALTHAKDAKVGFPEETTGSTIHAEADVPIATLAAWNELGTDATPPRPFMRQGADILVTRRGLVTPHVRNLVRGRTHVDAFMITLGLLLKSSIEAAVKKQDFAPLAPSTVATKGSTEILVDSGEMLDNLDVHLDRFS